MSKRGLVGALLGFASWADGLGDLSCKDRYAVAYKPKRKKFKPSRQSNNGFDWTKASQTNVSQIVHGISAGPLIPIPDQAPLEETELKILVACEESQAVTKEFRRLGHEAYSCDIIPCSGGHPEWHLQQDAIPLLSEKWDMIIAFPPCTYLTVTGNRWFNVERYGEKAIQRHKDREEAIKFFMLFANASCEKIAIENPIGAMSTMWRKPDQIIHPYHFGDPARKGTCLWLKGLPLLKHTKVVEPEIIRYKNGKGTDSPWHMNTMSLPKDERAKARSKTYPGIARAMAEQWGG